MVESRQVPLAPQTKRDALNASAAALPCFVTALTLLALGLLAAPVLRSQADFLWSVQQWYFPAASWSKAGVVQDAVAWQDQPGNVFTTPVSLCSITPDGAVRLRPPATELPFLFNITPQALPAKQQSCGHCQAPVGDACNITSLPHTCCGVCQFDSRMCGRMYPGEGRSEAAVQHLLQEGLRLHEFSPCELFQRIRGRTLWFVGDSQTWHFYYALECFLREFAPTLQRSDPVPAQHMGRLVTARQMYCKRWWPVPPECLTLVHGTRVCIVRADTAAEMVGSVLPALLEQVPGFADDILMYNTGLHYFEFDGDCTPDGDCQVPGEGSRYVRELRQLAAFRRDHRGRLPATVWMDTPPQHFPGTGYYVGEFRAASCVPWEAWQRGEAVARSGGAWNVAAEPLVGQLADARLRTWNASIPFWATHIPGECTHWCQPSAYHLWLFLLNRVLRDEGIGGRPPVERAMPVPALRQRPAR